MWGCTLVHPLIAGALFSVWLCLRQDSHNPFTDFGFKCIFGREESKPFLMDFLNELLKEEPGFGTITDIRYLDKEKTSGSREERTVVYDILCQTADKSEKFIVEMQNSSQAYFTDRSLLHIEGFHRAGEEGGSGTTG